MKLSEMYPSRFVAGKELKGAVTITVAHAEFEEVRDFRTGEKKQKPVLYAEKARRGILITKTMNQQLMELFGDMELEGLKGKRFTVYPVRHQTGNIMICVKAAANGNGHVPAEPRDAASTSSERLQPVHEQRKSAIDEWAAASQAAQSLGLDDIIRDNTVDPLDSLDTILSKTAALEQAVAVANTSIDINLLKIGSQQAK